MQSADATARLARCFAAVFPGLPPQTIAGANRETVGEWDSVAAMTLLALAEQEFGVQFSPEGMDELESFAAILDYLQRATAARAV